MISLIELTQQLIARRSITPEDEGCQTILCQHLKHLGFEIEHLPFAEVNNFWAKRGKESPLFVFVGHTDVVPAGPLDKWESPPFTPTIRNGQLFGRGIADMKGSLAAMLVACEEFIDEYPNHIGSIAWLITSDEEGISVNGTAKVIEVLKNKNEKIDYCLVGEPTCEEKLGDTLKVGRRGSLSAHLIVKGKQGHIAYPQLAENPIHHFSSSLTELLNIDWDGGIVYPNFQPTSLQFSNIQAGTGAGNVIPDNLEVKFNFRYSPATTAKKLEDAIESILKKHHLKYQISWQRGALPFLSSSGQLRLACLDVIKKLTGIIPTVSTTGGTSDARFIAPLGTEIVEFGPCNRTIHQINECVSIKELKQLTSIYKAILKKILCK